MLSPDQDEIALQVIRCRRSHVSSTAVGYGGAALMAVVILVFVAQRATISIGAFYGGLSLGVVVFLMMLFLGVRGARSATLYLYRDRLVYHSLFGRTTLQKADIKAVGHKTLAGGSSPVKVYLWTFFGLWKPTWPQLYVTLTSGQTVWLREFNSPPASGFAVGNSYRELEWDVEQIREWLGEVDEVRGPGTAKSR